MENSNRGIKGILMGILILLILLVAMYFINSFSPLLFLNKTKTINKTSEIDIPLNDSILKTNITVLIKSEIPPLYKFESNYVDDSKLNQGSGLTREWIILNDNECPVQLTNSVGINTTYRDRSSRFTPIGKMNIIEEVAAIEIIHVLYDVFGEHLVSLSYVDIKDMIGENTINSKTSWYASDNQISEYYKCVSFVSKVRTKQGVIWNYNPIDVAYELSQIEIVYKEEFKPSNEKK